MPDAEAQAQETETMTTDSIEKAYKTLTSALELQGLSAWEIKKIGRSFLAHIESREGGGAKDE